MSDFPDHPFWDFSLAVYGADAVAPACLELQERHGADVNLLMFAAWFGATGRGRVDGDDVAALREQVGPWHEEVVRHLRALRVGLRGGFAPAPDDLVQSLRRRLQKVEIDAEHVEQLMLAAWADDRPVAESNRTARRAAARDNMAAYVLSIGGTADEPALDTVMIGVDAWLGREPD